jgi:hypothetical protein
MNSTGSPVAGRISDPERLQLHSRVWEPSGRRLLAAISADGDGGMRARSLDAGCGASGWLRLLSERAGPGRVAW